MTGTVVSVLPVFLAGALAVDLRRELGFGATGIGLSVAAFRFGAVLTSSRFGRMTDRIGARATLRSAVLVSASSSLVIGLWVRDLWSLLACLLVAGSAQSLAQPSANRMLVNSVRAGRRGLAFGFKQAAPPAASMLAGASVPLVAVTFGWRYAYLAVPVLMLPVLVGLRGRRTSSPVAAGGRSLTGVAVDLPTRRAIVVLSLAFGCGNAASGSVAAFFVDSSVTAGLRPDRAGVLLAVGSAAAIAVRLVVGGLCDRMVGHHLRVAAGLLGTGAFAVAALALPSPSVSAIAIVVALAGTWGFNGVYWFALMNRYPHAPGAVTGAVAPGGLIGAVSGPLVFGALADGIGYPAAWVFAAALSATAALAMYLGDRYVS